VENLSQSYPDERPAQSMAIAILTNNLASYAMPMAEGLNRMFHAMEVECKVFYQGHARLAELTLVRKSSSSKIFSMARKFKRNLEFANFILQLRPYDLIVLVDSIPHAFLRSVHPRLETLRKAFPRTPIVNYDLFFLATRGPWARHLREGRNPYVNIGGNFGLERYDWYLCASVVSEFALPEGDWPFNLIGVNLDDGTLYPEEKHEFMALVDFERPDHMRERAITDTSARRSPNEIRCPAWSVHNRRDPSNLPKYLHLLCRVAREFRPAHL
jgi:hypothetical protein